MADKDYDDFIASGLARLKPGAPATAAPAAASASPDDAYDEAIKRGLAPITQMGQGVQQQVQISYDPNADWDSFRQAFDSAVFGKYSGASEARTVAKAKWEAGNKGVALGADMIGAVTPGVVFGTLAEQGIFRAGQVVGRVSPYFRDIANFLVGQSKGGKAIQAASKLAQGATQGAVQTAYEHEMDQPDRTGSNMLLGAAGNLGTHIAFAPQYSNVSPATQRLMREWSKNELAPVIQQIPGASPVAKLWGRLFGAKPVSMEDVTASLMRTTGSAEPLATSAAIGRQRAAIKSGLGAPFSTMTDDEFETQANLALNMGTISSGPQIRRLQQALGQWNNLNVVERSVGPDGIASPRSLLAAVNAANKSGTQIDPVINTLSEGASQFSPKGTTSSGIGHAAGKVGLGAALGVGATEGIDFAMQAAEHVMPGLPAIAHAGAAYGALNAVTGLPLAPLQNTSLYRALLARGGVGPGVNPLTIGIMQNDEYRSRANALTDAVPGFVTPAEGSTMRATTPPSDMPGWQRRTFQIESNMGRDPSTFRGSNIGYAQWGDEEQRRYGIKPGDWASEMNGLAKERAYFDKVLGRPTTDSEFYLMHQQGVGGGPALLAGGDTPAWQAVRPHYSSDKAALRAISGNMPSSAYDPSQITAKQFSQLWQSKFNAGLQPGGVQVSAGPTSSGLTSALQPITGPGPSQDEIANIIQSNALTGSQ